MIQYTVNVSQNLFTRLLVINSRICHEVVKFIKTVFGNIDQLVFLKNSIFFVKN